MAENTTRNSPEAALGHYKVVIHSLGEATVLLRGNGSILALNPPAAALLGEGSHTWVGQAWYDHLDSGVAEFHQYIQMCSRTRQLMVGTVSVRSGGRSIDLQCKAAVLTPRTEGEEATLIVQLFPKYISNAQFIGLEGRIRELNAQIVKRQKVEIELRAQTERLQVILQSIGDAVIITDASGIVTFLNPIAEKLTGWDMTSAMGRGFAEVFRVVHEASRLNIENLIERVLREKRIVNQANNSLLISRSGVELPIANTAAPIHFNGEVVGVVVVFHDVSMERSYERQLVERAERLEEENRQKNAFLAMLAHELRNPLAPISNAVHLLGSDVHSPIALNILQRQVSYLTQLTNSLLDVSRMIHGKVQIAMEETDIRKAVQDSCEDFSILYEQKGVSLDLALPTEPVWIMADPVRLAQVITNLLGNSLKFTPPGGTVAVSLAPQEKWAVLRIADTGIGMDPRLLPNLFRPFMQGEQTLARSYGGLGLGLAMVKEIVELHSGSAAAESAGKDQGATFTVMLPLLPRQSAHAMADTAGAAFARTILLIEDNSHHAETLAMLLRLSGNTVHTAADGVEGVAKATALTPDIVICDIGLPKLDGFSVARSLRGDERTRGAFMVALTGYGQDDFVMRAKEAGFDGYYLKPMKLEDIRKLTGMAAGALPKNFEL